MPYIGKQPANVPVTADDIPNDSITAAKIVDAAITIDDIGPNAVGNSEMADDAIGLNELSATGTTNTSTFLRGDNSWAVPPTTDISGKLNLSGGAMTGAITTNSTFDGVDIATRDAVLTSTTTTANAALPKAGGTMTGNVTHSSGYLDMGSGHIYLADNAQVKFGTSEDLQIYHDGSNSYIRDAGVGDIHIRSDAGFRVQNAGGTENYIYAEANGKVRLYYDNNTKLDTTSTGIDVTGGVNIGSYTANNNADNLVIQEANDFTGITLAADNDQGSNIYFADPQDDNVGGITYNHTNNYMMFRGNGAETMRINSSGNVGIGIVPESHNTSHDALQLGGNGVWTSYAAQGASGEMDLQHNAYFDPDGNDKYISTDEATKYRQGGGKHQWYTAASGSGNVSWSHAMTIANDGDVSIGATTSGNYKFLVSGAQFNVAEFKRTNNYGAIINITNGTGTSLSMGMDDDEVRYLGSSTTKYLAFGSSGSNANFHGNVGIGTTTMASPEGNSGPILQIGDGSNAMSSIVLHEDGNKWEVVSNNDLIIQDESVVRLRIAQAGDITFSDTSQAAKVTISNNGNVGIGETTPIRKFVIAGGSGNSSTMLLHMDADTAGGECGIEFKADSTNDDRRVKAAIKYRRDDPGTRGTGNLHFCVNGDNNDVNVTTSHSRMMLNTDGLHFNGDTAAANALDDYEEGTWTASFHNGTLSGGNTTGYYTKVGNLVNVTYYSAAMTISNTGGSARVSGLPYAINPLSSHYAAVTYTHGNAVTGVNNWYLDVSNTNMYAVAADTTTSPDWQSGSGKYMMLTVTYRTT